ncbi:MAG: hypothetical protein ACRBN8_44245 [Nannocystales bacterium]
MTPLVHSRWRWALGFTAALLVACAARSEPQFAEAPSRPAVAGPSEPARSSTELSSSASPAEPTPARRPTPDLGWPRLTIAAQDLAADEGFWTTYEIATDGGFLINAEGSTGGSEVQGSDCVGRLPAKDAERFLRQVEDAATLGQPPPGRSLEDAAAQDRWLDYTISVSGDGKTAAYVADPDRWAERLGPLMKQAQEAGTCTEYRETR